MNIVNRILPTSRPNRPGTTIAKTSVTIHETGNTKSGANALAHASYLESTSDKVSWHYTVDSNRVVQHIPEAETAWHSGTTAGNTTSIGIEICINPDGEFARALANAAELVADILHRYGWGMGKVKQHYDWNKKNCPENLRKSGWAAFVASIKNNLDALEVPSVAWVKTFTPGDVAEIRPIMGAGDKAESIDAVQARHGCDYIFNASAFTAAGVIDGALTVDGKVYSTGRSGHGFAMRGGEWRWSYLNGLKWPHFLGGFGLLARNGKKEIVNPHSGKTGYTALGSKLDGSLVVAMDKDGLTTDQLADYMLSIGYVNAVRMDGGGSVQGRGPDLDIRSTRLVPVYLGVWLKKDDINKPSAWAKEAVDWAVKNGLLVGDDKGDLKLQEPLTREQMCVMLYRYHGKTQE